MGYGRSDNWTLSTRSEVRSATGPTQLRKTNYFLRIIPTGIIAIALYYVVNGVRNRSFSVDGPGYFLYYIHDEIYLWLYGNFWFASFPYSLVWFVPLMFVLAIVAVEFLTPIKLTKIVQRFVTIRLLGFEIGRRILSFGLRTDASITSDEWNSELNSGSETVHAGAGFSRRVVIELLTENRIRLLNAVEDGNKSVLSMARNNLDLIKFRIELGASGPVVLFGSLECMAIYYVLGGKGLTLMVDAESADVQLEVGFGTASRPADLAAIKQCIIDLIQDTLIDRTEASRIVIEINNWVLNSTSSSTTCELAGKFLRASRLILVHKLPEGRDLLDSWTLRRLGVNWNEVVQAERLVNFTFWSKRIEEVASQYQLNGLVAQLWPGRDRLAKTGEDFAWSGSLSK